MKFGSAHGKVILFGEYAVLAGITGYAVALEDFSLSILIPDDVKLDIAEILEKSTIESNIPKGAGLGSSAALSVAIARAFNSENLFSTAKVLDDHFHNGSSGIDTFTVISGGLCSFNVDCGGQIKLEDEVFCRLDRFQFSIIDTGEYRKVSDVKNSVTIDEHALNSYCNSIKPIIETFKDILMSNELTLDRLSILFNLAHSALKNLGVSTPQIEQVVDAIKEKHPSVGIKITGAGGGGCLLLVHDCESITKQELEMNIPSSMTLYYNVKLKK